MRFLFSIFMIVFSYHVCTEFVGETKNEIGFFAYPNPAKEIINLNLRGNFSNGCNVSLFDAVGKQLRNYQNVKNNYLGLERSNLPPGIYFVKVSSGKNKKSLKIILD